MGRIPGRVSLAVANEAAEVAILESVVYAVQTIVGDMCNCAYTFFTHAAANIIAVAERCTCENTVPLEAVPGRGCMATSLLRTAAVRLVT
jgi:hypothetical protein